jgi:hypothetical protein
MEVLLQSSCLARLKKRVGRFNQGERRMRHECRIDERSRVIDEILP